MTQPKRPRISDITPRKRQGQANSQQPAEAGGYGQQQAQPVSGRAQLPLEHPQPVFEEPERKRQYIEQYGGNPRPGQARQRQMQSRRQQPVSHARPAGPQRPDSSHGAPVQQPVQRYGRHPQQPGAQQARPEHLQYQQPQYQQQYQQHPQAGWQPPEQHYQQQPPAPVRRRRRGGRVVGVLKALGMLLLVLATLAGILYFYFSYYSG